MFVSTQVPSNVFTFAANISISNSGSLQLALADGRRLTTNIGRELQTKNQETAFALEVSLQGETSPEAEGIIVTNSVIYVARKDLVVLLVLFTSAYGMVW